MVLACYYDYKEVNKCINEELKDWTYFIPISGIYVENKMDFGSMSIRMTFFLQRKIMLNLKTK